MLIQTGSSVDTGNVRQGEAVKLFKMLKCYFLKNNEEYINELLNEFRGIGIVRIYKCGIKTSKDKSCNLLLPRLNKPQFRKEYP